jgi:predicted acetyltransferase
MELSVRTAKLSERSLVEEMMQDYLREFSALTEVKQNPDGSFHYPYLEYYWTDPARLPFLIRSAGAIVGFALIRNEMDPVNGQPISQVAEFFVIPAQRRTGLGQAAATKLWDMFPGIWTVDVLKNNTGAYAFWLRVVTEYTQGEFEETGLENTRREWTSFSFPSRSPMDIIPDNQMMDY